MTSIPLLTTEGGAHARGLAHGRRFAQEIADNVETYLRRFAASGLDRDAALVEGEFTGDDGGGYRWALRVSPLTSRQSLAQDGVSTAATTLFNVEVAISWPGHEGGRSVVLRTLRLGTAETGQ